MVTRERAAACGDRPSVPVIRGRALADLRDLQRDEALRYVDLHLVVDALTDERATHRRLVADATIARVGSAALVDISGAQAVLGAAGFTGSLAAVSATWASAVALLAVARNRSTGAAMGLVAGALVASPALGYGTGFIVPGGYIVTNHHVVTVRLKVGQRLKEQLPLRGTFAFDTRPPSSRLRQRPWRAPGSCR